MFRHLSRVAVCVAMIFGVQHRALADDATIIREAQDRADIQALMWRYVRALDSLDADAYAATYTEDGRFGAGANATSGHAALREMVNGLKAGRNAASPPMYHVITNSFIEFTSEDRALYHSYWMTMFGPAGEGTQPRVAAVGRGVDELWRVNGKWLIHSRNVAPQD
jgi:uncharacterized protein (TIGR02246 family)